MQQKYTADPQTAKEIRAFVREYEKEFNKNDPVAVAALCTEDAFRLDRKARFVGGAR